MTRFPRRRTWRASQRAFDESGQLMLVSGIVITIAFLMTALTLSEVGTLEREIAADKPLAITAEWRFLHDQLKSNLQTAVTNDVSLNTLKTTTFPAIAMTFRDVASEKGYDAVFRLAGDGVAAKSELDLRTPDTTHYDIWDGGNWLDQAYDGTPDGVLMSENWACKDESGLTCIQGVYVYMHLSDGAMSMDEVMLVALNFE